MTARQPKFSPLAQPTEALTYDPGIENQGDSFTFQYPDFRFGERAFLFDKKVR